MVLDFANEVQILDKGTYKPLVWKRYIEDIISLLHTSRGVVNQFNEQANEYHPTIKFTAEISVSEATSLDATFYRSKRFKRELVLDVRILFKPTEVFQDTFYTTFHPPEQRKASKEKLLQPGLSLLVRICISVQIVTGIERLPGFFH